MPTPSYCYRQDDDTKTPVTDLASLPAGTPMVYVDSRGRDFPFVTGKTQTHSLSSIQTLFDRRKAARTEG